MIIDSPTTPTASTSGLSMEQDGETGMRSVFHFLIN